MSPILIDSDVLVWLTRGYAAAARRLPVFDTWHISVITYIELAQGCRDKAELARLKKGLAARNTEIMPVTSSISRRASLLIDELALSHGLRLADALIGATAVEEQFTLLTGNAAHFGPISGLNIETFVP